MADPTDLASEMEELHRASAIAAIKPKYRPRGTCWNCEEPLGNWTQLYCDADCGDDHSKRERNVNVDLT